MRITEKIKDEYFWINLIVLVGFVLPIVISIIGALGYTYLRIEFMRDWYLFHWLVILGMAFGGPVILVLLAFRHYHEKKTLKQAQATKAQIHEPTASHSEKQSSWGLQILKWFFIIFFAFNFLMMAASFLFS